MRAPPSLKDVHPLGKAPVIEDGNLTLAESAVILRYIDDTYGEGRFAPRPDTPDAVIHDEWLHYAESSAALPIMITLLGGMTGGLPEGLKAFTQPELAKTLDYIEAGLTPGPFLMGESFTLADIQMSYLLLLAESTGLLNGHPALGEYLRRLEARPAFAKAVEVGGPAARSR
jgi:glutathione S-transferase